MRTLNRRTIGRKASPRVHLVLAIDDTYYSIHPNRGNATSIAAAYRLRKADGTIYDVSLNSYGAECDCPDFLFRRAGLDPNGCKHVQALVACGLLPAHETEEVGRCPLTFSPHAARRSAAISAASPLNRPSSSASSRPERR